MGCVALCLLCFTVAVVDALPRAFALPPPRALQGNIDPSIHATVPDHRLHLTEKGRQQAKEAGVRLKAMLVCVPCVRVRAGVCPEWCLTG